MPRADRMKCMNQSNEKLDTNETQRNREIRTQPIFTADHRINEKLFTVLNLRIQLKYKHAISDLRGSEMRKDARRNIPNFSSLLAVFLYIAF